MALNVRYEQASAVRLNEKGQCPACRRKPLVYKRLNPRRYCSKCDREFDIETGEQIEGFSWKKIGPSAFRREHFD